jgi:hypothetical protein
MGFKALYKSTTSNYNSATGTYALYSNTTGGYNSAIGYGAGYKNQTGSGNVFLGYKAGYNETGSNKLYIANSDANPLIYGNFSTGRVGIRTTNPKGTLDVNGPIYQRGVSLHADYVFEPGYKLESIEQHSEYMWQDKHLPAIPKAKVGDDGQEIIEVGAHQRGIVEELEKAHIYIEQLNKEIAALKSEKDAQIESLTKTNGDIKNRLAAMESLVAKLSPRR